MGKVGVGGVVSPIDGEYEGGGTKAVRTLWVSSLMVMMMTIVGVEETKDGSKKTRINVETNATLSVMESEMTQLKDSESAF